jgi:serine/threonine-protein kinase
MVHRDQNGQHLRVPVGLECDFVRNRLRPVKYNDRVGPNHRTLKHTTTGTPAYMAPEIVLGEDNVDRRADVYALGCVAYYLLTGQLVFEADTSMKMMLQHMQAQPVPPSERTELPIPRELDEIVLQCLQKDPNLRPQNAEELLKLLDRMKIANPGIMKRQNRGGAPFARHDRPTGARNARPRRATMASVVGAR